MLIADILGSERDPDAAEGDGRANIRDGAFQDLLHGASPGAGEVWLSTGPGRGGSSTDQGPVGDAAPIGAIGKGDDSATCLVGDEGRLAGRSGGRQGGVAIV